MDKINPHPNNPRKDLGDLTELADSIKANGIMQNLTVVPQDSGYCNSCSLYISSVGKCEKGYDDNERPPCTKWESKGCYTVVIGHRRLSAAKLAGLEDVPCVISNMDQKTQVSTMLLENMQRSDLTPYEEAKGFQMMLDLGETVDTIAEKTGFTKTTVKHRVKMLELDEKKFKKSVESGGSITDYIELEKIKDLELRNEVLASVGTPNFRSKMESVLKKEAWLSNRKKLLEFFSTFATEITSSNGLRFVRGFSSYSAAKDIEDYLELPDDIDSISYFYTTGEDNIYLYFKYPQADEEEMDEEEQTRIEEERKNRQERNEKFMECTERAYKLRKDFILKFKNFKEKSKLIHKLFVKNVIEQADYYGELIDLDVLLEILNLDIPEEEEFEFKHIANKYNRNPEKIMLILAYCMFDDSANNRYYYPYNFAYSENEELDQIYDFLIELGYEMSDEEKALRGGSHELFEKIEEEQVEA